MNDNPWFRALVVLGVITLSLYLLGQVFRVLGAFSDIIVVLFLAWLLAFILSPFTHSLQSRYGLPRALAAMSAYLLVFLVIGVVVTLIVPLGVEQLVQLGQGAPGYAAVVADRVQALQMELNQRQIPVNLSSMLNSQGIAAQIGQIGSRVVENTILVASGVASFMFNFVIVLVISFYMVLDGDKIVDRFVSLVPNGLKAEVLFFFDSINRTFGGFIRGTLIVAVIYGVGTALIMSVGGLGFVVLGAVLAFLLVFVPLIGGFLSMLLPMGLAALQGSTTKFLIVLVALFILQTIAFNVISPKVMGDALGMHPILVFIALLVGIKLAGVAGALFGVPVVGVAYAMFAYLIRHWLHVPGPKPIPAPAVDARRTRLREIADTPEVLVLRKDAALIWNRLQSYLQAVVARVRQARRA